MRTMEKIAKLAPSVALGVSLAALAGAGGWWLVREQKTAKAALGPGLYDLHYALAIDLPEAGGKAPRHAETTLSGRLEVSLGPDGFTAARVRAPVLVLNAVARALTDFPAGAEQAAAEFARPWLMRVARNGQVRDVRFARGISNATKALLMSVATSTAYVQPALAEAKSWSASENDVNGSYDAHYAMRSDGTVQKRWDTLDAVASSAKSQFTLDGPNVVAVHFEETGHSLATGEGGQVRFEIAGGLSRVGSDGEGWTRGLDPSAFVAFSAAGARVRARVKEVARSLATLVPLVEQQPETQTKAGHAALRDELTRAVATDPSAASQVAHLLREGISSTRVRMTFVEALTGAETPAAQHELAGLLGDLSIPVEHRVELLQGTTLMRRPDQELATALAKQSFGPDSVYGGKAAMALGAIAPLLSDKAAGSALTTSLVNRAGTIVGSNSVSPGQRIAWLEALGNSAAPAALPTILSALQNDPVELVRVAAAHALRFQDPASSLEAMDKAMRDASPLVRYQLLRSALWMGPTAMLPFVQRALVGDKNEYVRRGAAYTIAVWMTHAPGLSSVLQNALAREKNLEVRESLMNYLNPGRVAPPSVLSPVASE